ncbi:hypothetical protein SEA_PAULODIABOLI_343 [Microbacterium phage PauloDiaboli]|nr:hypothetical protein SEA_PAULODIABOLI_343 [Microbacterium phage PauloDiaboli]
MDSDRTSDGNPVLRDLRYYVRHAKRFLNKDPYQTAFSKMVAKRDYDDSYVSLHMERITDPDVLDFAQKVLYRLAIAERNG